MIVKFMSKIPIFGTNKNQDLRLHAVIVMDFAVSSECKVLVSSNLIKGETKSIKNSNEILS